MVLVFDCFHWLFCSTCQHGFSQLTSLSSTHFWSLVRDFKSLDLKLVSSPSMTSLRFCGLEMAIDLETQLRTTGGSDRGINKWFWSTSHTHRHIHKPIWGQQGNPKRIRAQVRRWLSEIGWKVNNLAHRVEHITNRSTMIHYPKALFIWFIFLG